MNGIVSALAVDGAGNLYAGGWFTTAGGVSANYIAMWDGTAWAPLGSGMGGDYTYVSALAVDGAGNLYAGDNFTTAGGVSANYIAMWNGTAWAPLGSGMDGYTPMSRPWPWTVPATSTPGVTSPPPAVRHLLTSRNGPAGRRWSSAIEPIYL